MKARAFRIFLLLGVFLLAKPVLADTIILQDGTSYTGQLGTSSEITFTDNQGVQYRFPATDVQSLTFTGGADVVSLRDGKVYSGHYTGGDTIAFMDNQGISYTFPVKDVASVVFSRNRA